MSKFDNKYVLQIVGINLDVYEDSYEEGEEEYVSSSTPSYIDYTTTIGKEELTKDNLTKIIMGRIHETMFREIENDWVAICDDSLHICTNETENYYGTSIVIGAEKYKEAESDGVQVYSCHYTIIVKINGEKLTNEDLLEYTNFTE